MILKTLTLKNFRKFKNTTIEFPDGVIGVVGLNGVGKSTIFEAIAWVLYGSVAARTPAEQIKREGAPTTEPCRVELDFEFEGNSYRIIREMTGKSQTVNSTATVNGKIAATSAETVNKYMRKKLGMDFKSFFTSIFARQKELNALSSMNASERRPLILRMLGIDSLDDVIKEIKTDKKTKDNIIEKLESELVNEQGKNRIEIFKKEVEQLGKEKQEINKTIKKSKENLKNLEKELKQHGKKYIDDKKSFEKINQEKEKLSEKKTIYENKIKLQQEIQNLSEKIQTREKTIEKQKTKIKSFENIEKDLKTTEEKLKDIGLKSEDFVKKIEQKKTMVETFKKEIKNIESKKDDIEKIGPDAKCPTCDRTLKEQYNVLIERFEKDVSGKEKEIENFSKQIKNLENDQEKIFREEQALEKKKNYLQEQLREKERIVTTVENLQNELKQEKAELEKRKSEFGKIKSVVFDVKTFENVKKQVESFYQRYQKSLDFFNEKKEILNSLKLDLEKKEGEEKLVLQEIKNLDEKIKELQSFKKRIQDEKKTISYLSMLSEVMSSFRIFLISRIRPTLSSYASDFFDRLTDGKYSEIELDENYNLMIYDQGNMYNVERFSGGEEDLANLCIRLAISEVITERAGGVFNFVILDEIFGSQDSNRRRNIMKALNGLSSKFRQIFLITHVDELKNDMEHVIFVSEDEEGISTIKIE